MKHLIGTNYLWMTYTFKYSHFILQACYSVFFFINFTFIYNFHCTSHIKFLVCYFSYYTISTLTQDVIIFIIFFNIFYIFQSLNQVVIKQRITFIHFLLLCCRSRSLESRISAWAIERSFVLRWTPLACATID